MISVSQKSIVLSRRQHVRTSKANRHTALDAVSVASWHDVRRELLFKMLLKPNRYRIECGKTVYLWSVGDIISISKIYRLVEESACPHLKSKSSYRT